MGEELSRVEDLLVTGVEEPAKPMSRVEAILRGEEVKPLSRVEEDLKNYNPPDYDYIDLSVTENGTYTPPSGKMYKKAVVDVPSQAPVLTALNATENGTYTPEQGYDGFDSAVVDVPATPLDNLSVTENGTYSPTSGHGFNNVSVNVAGGGYKTIEHEDIVTFTDGTDNFVKALEVAIEPVQDLHGYDYPWVGGAGKNKADSGYRCSISSSGEIFQADFNSCIAKVESGKTYTHSINGVESNVGVIAFYSSYPTVGSQSYDSSRIVNGAPTFTAPIDGYAVIRNASNTSNIQVEEGSTATSFAPYSNICPISGWSAVDVTNMDDISDKAFFDGLLNGTYGIVDLGTLNWTASSDDRSRFYATVPSPYYKMTTDAKFICSQYIGDGIGSSARGYYGDNGTVRHNYTTTLSPSAYEIYIHDDRFDTDATAFKTAMNGVHLIYELATPTTPTVTPSEINELYEEFGINGQTYSLTFTDGTNPLTVYGGYVDLVSGVLTVDRAYVDLGTLDWQYSSISERFYASATALGVKATDVSTPFNAISSALIAKSYNEIKAKTVDNAIGINPNATQLFARCSSITSASDFITAMNGVQLVYELATPLTYQLTPTVVETRLGDNNIFADTGEIELLQYWIVPMNMIKKVLTQAEYNQLTTVQKEDPTKIYFIHKLKDDQYVMEPYLYYMDKKYEYEVPFDLESDNTVQTTSTQYITLESGYHYLFTTIYSGGVFSNNTAKEGGASRVFNVDGYDRSMYIIKVESESATDTVTYARTGGIDSNKYIKFRIKQGDEYIDDAVFKNIASVDAAFTISTSPTLNLEAGKYYMISYKASLPPNLTGATPICYAYLGETDAKKSISMIIRADSDTVVINDYNTSYSYFYYQKLLT